MKLYIDNTLLLKPIPPEIKTCPTCKLIFLSFLRMDAKQFITCDDYRTAPLAKLAQGESGVPANLVRTAWVQFLPTPARSMLCAFHQAVCLPLLRFQ